MNMADETRRLIAYGLASVVALGVDVGGYFLLIDFGTAAPLAAVLGYALGIVVHWLASSRMVFVGHMAAPGRARTVQMGLFIASAVVGLAITWTVVKLALFAGIGPALAKLCAIGISFGATFWLRRCYVFNMTHKVRLA